ncbi:hypothetical protein FBZ84_104289 [Azospirillum baldaniorum]|nr:hypothetical protein FBZ84_104289 [Azospirillum baldaniorum]
MGGAILGGTVLAIADRAVMSPLPRGERVLDKVLESAIAKPVRRHTLAIADHRPGHRPDITKTSP